MLSSLQTKIASLVVILSLPFAYSQLVASLPSCVQTCINQSGSGLCSITDVKCLCRASNGNFLPDVITCMHGNCDNDLDTNLLLTPLQLACDIAGTPISSSAIANAENEASSLASQVTTTVTKTASESGSVMTATTTQDSEVSQSVVTLTTTASGATIAIVYPVTIDSTTTIYGSASTTLTQQASYTQSSWGDYTTSTSSYTSTDTVPSVLSTYTQADSDGQTKTVTSTYTSVRTSTTITSSTETSATGSSSGAGTESSDSVSSTTTQTTSVDAESTTAVTLSESSKSSKTAGATQGQVTNSDLLSTASRVRGDSIMGLWICVALYIFAL
jgi:hypothetical protein